MSGISKSPEDTLKCPVCYNSLLPPVYQCRRGHLVCKGCIPQLVKCPVCRTSIKGSRIRNLAIEQVISGQIIACSNSEEGCNVKLRGDVLEKHMHHCAYEPAEFCKMVGIDCAQHVAMANFVDHLLCHHEALGRPMDKTAVVQHFNEGPDFDAFAGSQLQWEPNYFIADDENFFCLILNTTLANGLMSWRTFPVFLDSDASLPMPFVKITLVKGDNQTSSSSLTWKGPATKLSAKPNDQPACFSLPVEYLRGVSRWRIEVQLSGAVTCERKFEDTFESKIVFQQQMTTTHQGIGCDGCGKSPIEGNRFKCTSCYDYDLCTSCRLTERVHNHHVFLVIPSGQATSKLRCYLHGPAVPGSYAHGAICNGCYGRIGKGLHFHCTDCWNYDLCKTCYLENGIHREHLFVLAPANDGDIDSELQNALSSLRAKGVVSEYRRPERATVLPNYPPSTDSDSEGVEDEYPGSEDGDN